MTIPAPAATSPHGETPPDTSCVCGHPVDEHDAVAIRYCRATVVGALTRSCMCTPAVRSSY